MKDNNKEKLLAGIPIITMECTEIVLNQMKECICKIKNKKGNGTGFFCKIPDKNINLLITNNHIINEEIINENHNIIVSLDNEKVMKEIKLDENKKIYTSEKYDTTIIEIKEGDNINKYIELDEDIFKENKIYVIRIYI